MLASLNTEIASITSNIDTLKADLKEKKTALKKAEKEAASLEAKKAKADATEKYRTIKKPFFQPQIRSNSPKPQSPRTCLIKRACTSKVQKRRESVLEQNGSGDTEQ